ncbi:MAG: hypothetical protein V4436_02330 [Patescibacteria group bacterium]
MRTVVDITAMAEWLGIPEKKLLDFFLLTANGKLGVMNGSLEEAKEGCIEADGSINCILDYCGAAAHFVRQVPDGAVTVPQAA